LEVETVYGDLARIGYGCGGKDPCEHEHHDKRQRWTAQ
jgi:hypothetical protein